MIDVAEIPAEQVERILRFEEGHFLDLKGRSIAPGKLSRSISAFANSSGGELYIGVTELVTADPSSRQWDGFPNVEAANPYIAVFEQLFPLGQEYSYVFLRNASVPGLVLQATIQKSRGIARATDGIPYLRRAAQNLRVDTEEGNTRLRRDKGIESFEDDTLSLDLALVTNSTVVLRFVLSVIPSAEPEDWLRKQQLIRGDRPTVASMILFAEEPQALLPKRCAIKIYRYKTTSDEGTRDSLAFEPATIEGCLIDQIRQAVEETIRIVEDIQMLGPKGLQRIEYPRETLHEIITNAVLHRDYSIPADIRIRVFDNRVEIESPGRLPGHMTPQNVLTEQFARNPKLVRVANKFPDPPNKDVGEGLRTAFEAMRRLKLREPKLFETQNSVMVDIRHESLASPEEAVMQYLDSHLTITNRVAREITAIPSENAVKEVFYRLRDRSLIERVPGLEGNKSAWRKVSGEDTESAESDMPLFDQGE